MMDLVCHVVLHHVSIMQTKSCQCSALKQFTFSSTDTLMPVNSFQTDIFISAAVCPSLTWVVMDHMAGT